MRKPLVLAISALLTMSAAQTQAATAATATATALAVPAWVERSNDDAKLLMKVIADFSPEAASQFGLPGYDDKVVDLKPGVDTRFQSALTDVKTKLTNLLAQEQDANVRQDLQILLKAADIQLEGNSLRRENLLPFYDVGEQVFGGEFALLQDQVEAKRRPSALKRLECYVGSAPGCTPITELAKARTTDRLNDKQLLGPYVGELQRTLGNTPHYVDGVRKLFAKYKLDNAEGKAALDKLEAQLKDYDAWLRSTVQPRARTDFRLPEALYAYNLKQVGLDIPPQQLIKQAELEFMETRAAMQQLAPLVAKADGIQATDYRDVLKALKKDQLSKDQVEPWYHQVIGQIEQQIRSQRIVELPQREMIMRLASDAESAQQPAPHMDPPPFIGNTGQRGTFVLTMGNPSAGGGAGQAYDDFTFKAAAWTLTAHEGRPGHELQFSAMIEHGVSLARSLFAFNSVNVEGWALYSEAEMVPYEPLDGQFIALQLRLLRAARAFLDPMLNLGLIDRERAHQILVDDVGVSEAMAKQELDRYTFNSPGQATAYFYGYSRLLQLRMEAEIALGTKFDRKAFNDFVIGQGLLPPDQLADAVRSQFIPAQRGAAAK